MVYYFQSRASIAEWTDGGHKQDQNGVQSVTEVEYLGEPWIRAEILSPGVGEGGYPRCRAELGHWGDVGQRTHVFAGWRYMVPSSLANNNWLTIGQLKGKSPGYDGAGIHFYSLQVTRAGNLRVRWDTGETGPTIVPHRAELGSLPQDTPFTVIVELRVANPGILRIWIDGVLIFEDLGDHSCPFCDRPGPALRGGIYQSIANHPNWLLFRDVCAASTKAEVDAWLTPTPVSPLWQALALASGSAPVTVVVGAVVSEELRKLGVLP